VERLATDILISYKIVFAILCKALGVLCIETPIKKDARFSI